MKFFFTFLLFSFIALIGTKASAQATIGSGNESLDPAEGSLLDMKENRDGTSNRGMMLPRVELQDMNKLIMGSADYTGKELEHAGLIVFNIKDNPDMPVGAYVWNGSQWVQLSRRKESIGRS